MWCAGAFHIMWTEDRYCPWSYFCGSINSDLHEYLNPANRPHFIQMLRMWEDC